MSLSELLDNGPGRNRPEEEEPQRIFRRLNGVVVMLCLMGIFSAQYLFLNGYLTLLLVSILLAGALGMPSVYFLKSDSLGRRLKVKFCFLLCGTLSFYLIILFGIYFNRTCSCHGSA